MGPWTGNAQKTGKTRRKWIFFVLRNQNSLKLKKVVYTTVYFFLGHFGTGKTLLGIEVTKIKMAWFCKEEMEVHILTFNLGQGTFRLLNDELKSKWDCDNLLDNQAKISHISESILKFDGSRVTSSSELKEILRDTAVLLNKENKKYIIMIDEIGKKYL